ncbi:MAG: hypothetical protein AAF682_04715 [Planctomycetota bacterium]
MHTRLRWAFYPFRLFHEGELDGDALEWMACRVAHRVLFDYGLVQQPAQASDAPMHPLAAQLVRTTLFHKKFSREEFAEAEQAALADIGHFLLALEAGVVTEETVMLVAQRATWRHMKATQRERDDETLLGGVEHFGVDSQVVEEATVELAGDGTGDSMDFIAGMVLQAIDVLAAPSAQHPRGRRKLALQCHAYLVGELDDELTAKAVKALREAIYEACERRLAALEPDEVEACLLRGVAEYLRESAKKGSTTARGFLEHVRSHLVLHGPDGPGVT